MCLIAANIDTVGYPSNTVSWLSFYIFIT